jgi:hypothetical protein
MVDRSRSEIVKAKPIGQGLNNFRDTFNSTYIGLRISGSFDALHHIGDEGTIHYPVKALPDANRPTKPDA